MVVLRSSLEGDVESGTKIPSWNRWWRKQPIQLTYGLAYSFFSISMILTNKMLRASFDFNAPNCLLLFQFLTTIVLVDAASTMGLVKREPLEWSIVKIWWPVNVLFVTMIGSGFYTLKSVNVPMVTLLKNCTNLLTILGDMYFFGKRYSIGVWASLGLIVVSSMVGTYTDVSFEVEGYGWMVINIVSTAAYMLYLKAVLKKVEEITSKSGGLGDISKVYYNHVLGLPWLMVLIVTVGEMHTLLEQPALKDPRFLVAAIFSGVAGFALSFAALRYLSATTATTYAMTGSVSKIVTAVLGWIMFDTKTTTANVLSVIVGLIAGIVFGLAKAAEVGGK